jgi:hypothetical protein
LTSSVDHGHPRYTDHTVLVAGAGKTVLDIAQVAACIEESVVGYRINLAVGTDVGHIAAVALRGTGHANRVEDAEGVGAEAQIAHKLQSLFAYRT